MAQLHGFNANNVDPHTGFDPIPAGRYECAIVESSMKPTKNGQGQYLELVLEVLGGPHKGRKVWDNLNIVHPNDKAVEIAQSVLSAVCRAVGVMTPRDSLELHNRPMLVSIGLRRREDGGDYQNVVRKYEAITPGAFTAPGVAGSIPPSGTPTPHAGSADATAPWKRPDDGKANALTAGAVQDDDDTPI